MLMHMIPIDTPARNPTGHVICYRGPPGSLLLTSDISDKPNFRARLIPYFLTFVDPIPYKIPHHPGNLGVRGFYTTIPSTLTQPNACVVRKRARACVVCELRLVSRARARMYVWCTQCGDMKPSAMMEFQTISTTPLAQKMS